MLPGQLINKVKVCLSSAMPKKGKGKGKGKKKGKGKDKKAPQPTVDTQDDFVDEMSKRFYTIQIVVC